MAAAGGFDMAPAESTASTMATPRHNVKKREDGRVMVNSGGKDEMQEPGGRRIIHARTGSSAVVTCGARERPGEPGTC